MGKIAERIFMITLIGTLLGFGVKNINAHSTKWFGATNLTAQNLI